MKQHCLKVCILYIWPFSKTRELLTIWASITSPLTPQFKEASVPHTAFQCFESSDFYNPSLTKKRIRCDAESPLFTQTDHVMHEEVSISVVISVTFT